jgi:hypothetical protein
LSVFWLGNFCIHFRPVPEEIVADGSLSRNSQQYKGNKQSLTTPVLVVMHPLQDAESMGLGSNTGLSHGKKANTT